VKYKIINGIKLILSRKVSIVCTTLDVIAVVQLALTVLIPVGNRITPTELYSRNFLSILAFLCLSLFLRKWAHIFKHKSHRSKTMKRFKMLIALVWLICLGKIALSGCYGFKYLILGKFAGLYYLGDAIAWGFISGLLIFLFKNLESTRKNDA